MAIMPAWSGAGVASSATTPTRKMAEMTFAPVVNCDSFVKRSFLFIGAPWRNPVQGQACWR